MNITKRWDKKVRALEEYVKLNGTALVPATTKINVDGEVVSLGPWVCATRAAYHRGDLMPHRISQLEAFAGWSWGPLKPGRKVEQKRDEEIIEARQSGQKLEQIAERYNLSRQRVHQIVKKAKVNA
jgi:DNA-binding NarL/FixJ family response regulator